MPKKLTLREYCDKLGAQEAAAHKIGVSFVTVNRWLKGKDIPTGLSRRRLDALGIGEVKEEG